MTTSSGSRSDFDSLVPWARTLFASGASAADVMRMIYGVDLPLEFYVLAQVEARGTDLPYDPMVHPWQLLIAADPAHTPYTGDVWARRQEERAFHQHPDFLPMMRLSAPTQAKYDGYIIGYDLAALRSGKVSILGHKGEIPATGAKFQPVGESLLGVMHGWATDNLRIRRAQLDDPKNFGFGSITDEEVDEAVELVAQIEALQREVSSRLASASHN